MRDSSLITELLTSINITSRSGNNEKKKKGKLIKGITEKNQPSYSKNVNCGAITRELVDAARNVRLPRRDNPAIKFRFARELPKVHVHGA